MSAIGDYKVIQSKKRRKMANAVGVYDRDRDKQVLRNHGYIGIISVRKSGTVDGRHSDNIYELWAIPPRR